MEIKMPVKFLGSYKLTVRSGGEEKQELCQKLNFAKLSSAADAEDASTHLITWYCFGCKRVLEGRLKESDENRAVFQSEDRELEFRPAGAKC
jgi:hypothetical protein